MTDQGQPIAGWYPDPIARFAERYWDGTQWTERVRNGLIEEIDPQWQTPAAYPQASADAGAAAGSGAVATPVMAYKQGSGALFDRERLRDEVMRDRPRATAQEALAAVGGFVATMGLLVLVAWMLISNTYDTPGRGEVGIIGVVALAVAYAWAIVGPRRSRAAGLTGAIVGPMLIVGAIFFSETSGRGTALTTGLLLTAVWAAMFFGPGFTGAPILLFMAVWTLWGAAITMVTPNQSSPYYDPYSNPYGGYFEPVENDFFSYATSTIGVVSLIFAIVCICAARVADDRGARVLGTPLLAVAVLQSMVGVTAASNSGAGVSILAVAVGAAFVVVGAGSQRRGSIWIGAATATAGLFSLIIDLASDAISGGIMLLAVGAGMVLVGPAIDRFLHPKVAADESQPQPL